MNHKRLAAFLCLLPLSLLQTDLFAQQKIIIIASNSNLPPFEAAITGFKEALFQDNIDFKIVDYDLTGPLPPETDRADLIFTVGSNSTQLMAEKIQTIPIVFTLVMEPKFSSQNITGVTLQIPLQQQLAVLSKISPRPKKIGILYNPEKTKKLVESYVHESGGKGFEVLTKQVSDVGEVYSAIRDFRPSIDCLFIIPDSTVYTINSTEDILLYSLREGLPVVGISPTYVKAGALFSISCNYKQLGKQSGEIAARILRGEKPSDIPYASPDKYDLSVNLIVARRMGVTLPDKLLEEAVNVYK